jgi:hypothetical protein
MTGTMGSTRGDVDAKLSTWGFRHFDFVEAVNRIGAVRSPDQNLAPRPAESQRQLTLLLGARLETRESFSREIDTSYITIFSDIQPKETALSGFLANLGLTDESQPGDITGTVFDFSEVVLKFDFVCAR